MPKNIWVVIFVLSTIFLSISFAQTELLNESFTGTTFPPTGWARTTYGYGEDWERYTSNYYSSPACARIRTDGYFSRNNDWLFTKRIGPIYAGDSIIFYARKDTDDEILYIRVSTNASQTDTSNYGNLTSVSITSTSWTRFARSLATYAGNDSIYIAFWYRESNNDEVRLDDVLVKSFPTTTYNVTFNQTGLSSDYTGTVLTIDGTNNYTYSQLPVSFSWSSGSSHTFRYWDTLTVSTKRYIWTSTSGLASTKSGTIVVSSTGSVIGNYTTQYRLTMATNFGTTTPVVGTSWHNAGAGVSIDAASPGDGTGYRYLWNNWTGTGTGSYTGTTKATSVTMNAPITQTASWTHQYQLRMAANFGTTTPAIGTSWQNAGAVVSISASAPGVGAGEQYVFSPGWIGTGTISYTGTVNASSVTMNSPIAESAAWTHQYYLTVNNGGHSSVSGEDWYDSGTTAYASVTDSIVTSGTTRYVFKQWTVNATGTKKISNGITMDAAKTATASWTTQYELTMAANFGTTTPSIGSHWYDEGTVLTISATAPTAGTGERYVWNTWTGTGTISYSSTANPATDLVTMNSAITETASWTHQYYLTVSSVYATPGGSGWYDAGTNAYATVTPETIPVSPGIRILFSGWSGGATGSHSPSDPIYMGGPKTAVGSWGLSTYLTVNSAHSTTSGEGWYNAWLPYTARAGVADSIVTEGSTRYVFTGWGGDATGTNLISDNINMDWPRTATATWQTQYYLTLVTNPSGITTPSGEGWCDENSNAPISTPLSVNVPPIHNFSKWTTLDMSEIADSLSASTTVYMDASKTVTANYVYYDVGVVAIAPIGIRDTIEYCNFITPQVTIHNYGVNSGPVNGQLTVDIYRNLNPSPETTYQLSILNLRPCVDSVITFTQYHPDTCFHRIVATVDFSPDQNSANDTKEDTFVVRYYDVGVVAIAGIPDTVEYCTNISPQITIHNYGVHTGPVNGQLTVDIYRNHGLTPVHTWNVTVNNLRPCVDSVITLAPYHPDTCFHRIVATVSFSPDQNSANDTKEDTFVVKYHDVAVVALLDVPSSIQVSDTMYPKVVIHNNGVHTWQQDGTVHIKIYRNASLIHTDSKLVTGLEPCHYDTIDFMWIPAQSCNHQIIAWIEFNPDQNRHNDTLPPQNFVVQGVGSSDIAITILQPKDTVTICNSYLVNVQLENTGHIPSVCTVDVKIWRYRVKIDSLCNISVNPLDSEQVYAATVVKTVTANFDTITLTPWHPTWTDLTWLSSPTYHVIYATVKSSADPNPANDLDRDTIIVKGRNNDLQVNAAILLRGSTVFNNDTLRTGTSYNTMSVVSNNSPAGRLTFRSWFKIIQVKTNQIVYSRYLDRTLNPMTYACLYYSSGWAPQDTGWYKITTWIETRPCVDVTPENNSYERYYFATRTGTADGGVQGDIINLPQICGVLQNAPNPFYNMTTIRWQIPVASKVRISVYDAAGRIVKTLVNSDYVPGYYTSTWDGADHNNQKVAAGIYFYEMKAGNFTQRRKMIITQ